MEEYIVDISVIKVHSIESCEGVIHTSSCILQDIINLLLQKRKCVSWSDRHCEQLLWWGVGQLAYNSGEGWLVVIDIADFYDKVDIGSQITIVLSNNCKL